MVSEAPDTVIELKNVAKVFGSTTAVRDLSFCVPKGTAFGLIGPNGAGKTTTLKMMMGILPCTNGRMNILGLDVSSHPQTIKQRLGYVPEQNFIHRWMRVGEAINFCRSFYPTWNEPLCGEMLKRFDLGGGKKVRHLSKGMLAKLSLVLALAHDPEVLILDEPMGGLDPIAREEFLEGVMANLADQHRTVVFSSHLLGDVQRMVQTVGIIDRGELLTLSSMDNLLKETKRIRGVLRDGCQPKQPPAHTIWQRVQGREWLVTVGNFTSDLPLQLKSTNPVQDVEVIDLTLEDIFKDYIKGRRVQR